MTFAAAFAAGEHKAPPIWLDRRFDAKGRPVRDSGATVICHITDPAENAALAAVRDQIRAVEGGGIFAWLPPSSYHMTVFDFLLHNRRAPDFWPAGLAPDVTNDAADAWAAERLKGISLDEPTPLHVKPTGIYLSGGGLGVAVEGATPADETSLRRSRDRLARATGLSHRPGHDEYRFHITLAYLIAWPTEAHSKRLDTVAETASMAMMNGAQLFTLRRPEFCLFLDMTEFSCAFTI